MPLMPRPTWKAWQPHAQGFHSGCPSSLQSNISPTLILNCLGRSRLALCRARRFPAGWVRSGSNSVSSARLPKPVCNAQLCQPCSFGLVLRRCWVRGQGQPMQSLYLAAEGITHASRRSPAISRLHHGQPQRLYRAMIAHSSARTRLLYGPPQPLDHATFVDGFEE
jgi:hypothetical protein